MPTLTAPPIFDGHNDILSVLYQSSSYPDIAAFGRSMPGHLDSKKAETGGFAGGFLQFGYHRQLMRWQNKP